MMRDQCSNEPDSALSGEGGRRAPLNGAVASPPSAKRRRPGSRGRQGNLTAATGDPADEIKSFYWQNHGIAVVRIDDPRLDWVAREFLVQHMTRQHGPCRKLEK
jgi:hypothetical protein